MFFADRLSKASSQGTASANRILMAAHTNVAVDRVLNGLLDQGFTGDAPWLQTRPITRHPKTNRFRQFHRKPSYLPSMLIGICLGGWCLPMGLIGLQGLCLQTFCGWVP